MSDLTKAELLAQYEATQKKLAELEASVAEKEAQLAELTNAKAKVKPSVTGDLKPGERLFYSKFSRFRTLYNGEPLTFEPLFPSLPAAGRKLTEDGYWANVNVNHLDSDAGVMRGWFKSADPGVLKFIDERLDPYHPGFCADITEVK